MALFDINGNQISGFPNRPGPGRPSQMMPQYQAKPPFYGAPSKPGPGRPSQMSPPAQTSQQKPRSGPRSPYSRYAPGTDMSQVQRTDTLQPNPMYKPGAASPVPPPSYGVPYGQPGLQPMAAPLVPAADEMQLNGDLGGNLAYATPDKRPAPFTQSMNFMGQPVDPGQFYGQRDAFIQNINQAKQPFAMNPAAGRPQMNFGGMWNQAGNMVQKGWQNPLQGLMGQGRMMSADAWEDMYPGQPMPDRPQSNGWIL